VLVGDERSRPIRVGLAAASFPEERIHVVANSSEAEALLARTTRRGDVVLFENDLPDLYAEDGAPPRERGSRGGGKNGAARH
jgi:UDP-N-acetylmuramoyl-tripeptide--D-alanyl-D-alanine ligase